MKKTILALALCGAVQLRAESPTPKVGVTNAGKSVRILCVGDSITAGYTDNPKWEVPFEFGYRAGLFERLAKAGYQVQFVGSSPSLGMASGVFPKTRPHRI